MGKLNNQLLSNWQVFSTQLRSLEIRHSKCILTIADQETVRDAIVLWCSISWDIFEIYTSSSVDKSVLRDFLDALLQSLKTHCIDELIDALKERDEALLTLVESSGRSACLQLNLWTFRFRRGFRWIGELCRNMLAAGETNPYVLVSSFHQICAFLTRLNLTVPSLKEEAEVAWIARQEVIRDRPEVDFRPLREIIESWMSTEPVLAKYGRHGPGKTYLNDLGVTSKTVYLKYQHSCWTPCMRYVDRKYFGGESLHSFGYDSVRQPLSKLSFVPKSYSKMRSVASEDPGKMWVQQIGRATIDKWLQRHPVLSEHIKLHESEHNTSHAQIGSLTGSFATIDLSSASDDVSWELVKACFRKTSLYPVILSGRTGRVLLPSRRIVPLHSHATMGSALCFPIECIVFAAITALAIRSYGHDPSRQTFFVYGDDIVVGSRYAPKVLELLQYYGFSPNKEKTFIGDGVYRYRESCGGEYLNGVDVTPLRISRKFSGFPRSEGCSPQQFASCIQLANDLFERFPTARRLCVTKLLSLPQPFRPVFSTTEEGLISTTVTNTHLRRDARGSADYQRSVWHHGILASPRVLSPAALEPIRYEHWWTLYGCSSATSGELTARVSAVTESTAVKLKSCKYSRAGLVRKPVRILHEGE